MGWADVEIQRFYLSGRCGLEKLLESLEEDIDDPSSIPNTPDEHEDQSNPNRNRDESYEGRDESDKEPPLTPEN